jgi:hypothetical protein
MPLDVQVLGCDALAATGRKFLRGPRATGFLYVRRERISQMDPLPVDIHSATWTGPETYVLRPDARRFETWEQPIAGNLGLGAAVDYALGWGLDAIWERVQRLATRLRDRLAALPAITVQDPGKQRCGIVTFTVDGMPAAAVKAALAARTPRVNVTVSTRRDTRGVRDVTQHVLPHRHAHAGVDCQASCPSPPPVLPARPCWGGLSVAQAHCFTHAIPQARYPQRGDVRLTDFSQRSSSRPENS